MTETTRDALFRGALTLVQPRDGYRVNVDAILLAAFAGARKSRRACDLGAGVGAVGLALLFWRCATHLTFVEKESFAASLAETNAHENGFYSRAKIECEDVLTFARSHASSADLVVFNPPYAERGRGRVPVQARKAAARVGSLEAFVKAARAIAGARGRVCLSYPAHEATMVIACLKTAGLEPKRARFVHATPKKQARIVLIEAKPGKSGGLVIEAPLIERAGNSFTEELAALLAGTAPFAKGPILEP